MFKLCAFFLCASYAFPGRNMRMNERPVLGLKEGSQWRGLGLGSRKADRRLAPNKHLAGAERRISRAEMELAEIRRSFVKHANPEAVTLRFLANNRIVGTAACNDVGGDKLTWSADLPGTKGTFARNQAGATIITTAGCANASPMRAGSQFGTRMSGAHDWSLKGKALTIKFADGATALLEPKTEG